MIKADAGLTGRLFFKAGFSHVTGSGGKQEAGGDFFSFFFHHTQCGEGSISPRLTGLRIKVKFLSLQRRECLCEQRRQQTAGEEEQTG